MLGFLELPSEIRIQIYQLLFFNAKCKVPIYLGCKGNAMNSNRSLNPVVFRLNKTIFHEAMEELYGNNDFYLRPFTQENCLFSLGNQTCRLIHSLSIHVDGSDEEAQTFKDVWTAALLRLPRLEEIRIQLNHMRSFLSETIMSVTEALIERNEYSWEPTSVSPEFKLDLTIGEGPQEPPKLAHVLPWCAQRHTIWTNDALRRSPHNEDRVFDMDIPSRRALPRIVIEAITDPHEFSAIMHYKDRGWSFKIDSMIETRNQMGSRYHLSFHNPEPGTFFRPGTRGARAELEPYEMS